MIEWMSWALLLVAQNASSTWVSRARNSGSYAYHAVASVASNGVWILSMYFVVDKIHDAKGDPWRMLVIGMFYTLFTVTGSVTMHWLSINYLEKGKRKVGA